MIQVSALFWVSRLPFVHGLAYIGASLILALLWMFHYWQEYKRLHQLDDGLGYDLVRQHALMSLHGLFGASFVSLFLSWLFLVVLVGWLSMVDMP